MPQIWLLSTWNICKLFKETHNEPLLRFTVNSLLFTMICKVGTYRLM